MYYYINGMGIIYKLTSPSGKIYIGQTKCGLKQRLRQHKHYALVKKCETALGRAIRKYGYDSFSKCIETTCSDEYMDIFEKQIISIYDSNNPLKGYNLTSGGQDVILCDEVKKKISLSLRKHYDNNLPEYIRKTSNSKSGDYGYEIKNHPKCKRKIFTSRIKNDPKTLKRTMDYLNKLNTDTQFKKVNKLRDLPKYVSYDKTHDSYIVKIHRNNLRLKRSFGSKDILREERKKQAITQLNVWKKRYNIP